MLPRKGFENRKEILTQANNQCELCNSGERLHIHHKDLDKSNNTQENAQVLCQKCHTRLHKRIMVKHMWEMADTYPEETLEYFYKMYGVSNE